MKATRMIKVRQPVGDNAFVEIVVWQVPAPIAGSHHRFKYRLAYIVDDVCVVRYDNEAGKGDHKHLGQQEVPFIFTDVDTLLADFWHDVNQWRP